MEKEKSRIFIASGTKALRLAQTLRDALNMNDSEAVLWNEANIAKEPLTRDIAVTYDFAVFILSREDVVLKKTDDDMLRQVRDNCIYEFGVFMNCLGLKRCFLITSAMSDFLPLDLRATQVNLIEEPADLQDFSACKEAVRTVSEQIKAKILHAGKAYRGGQLPIIELKEVMRREMLKTDGGRLEEGAVVVIDKQPLESFSDAQQVKDNLDKGIWYYFYFMAKEDGAQKICKLLQMILVADLYKDKKNGKGESFEDRREVLIQNKGLILKSLSEIWQRETLNICFVDEEPTFQFRLHNASSSTEAKAYLRYDNGFVEWAQGVNAQSIYNYVSRFGLPQKDGIFRSSVFFNLMDSKAEHFRATLNSGLKRHFPEIDEEVKKMCYGEEAYNQIKS